MRWTAGLLTLALMGCPEPPTAPIDTLPTPVVVPVFGTYNLDSIKGKSLPYTLAEGPTSLTQVTGGALELASSMTFARTTGTRVTTPSGISEATSIQSGTYTKSNDGTVTLLPTGASETISGAVVGKVLTISLLGCCETWTYRRP